MKILANVANQDINRHTDKRWTKKFIEVAQCYKIKENNTFREDLAEAIQVALQFDDEIFMESAVDQVLYIIFPIVCTRSIEESYTVHSSSSLTFVFFFGCTIN